MELREFHNGLRVLTNLDFVDLVKAGVISDDADGDADWTGGSVGRNGGER